MYLPFTIKGTMNSGKGKYGSNQQQGMIAEYSQFMSFLSQNADPNLSPFSLSYLLNLDLYQHAEFVIFNLPPPRVPVYVGTNQDEITNEVVQWASQILYHNRKNEKEMNARIIGINIIMNKKNKSTE